MRIKIIAVCLMTALTAMGGDIREGIIDYTITSPTTVSAFFAQSDDYHPIDTNKIVFPESILFRGRELTVTAIVSNNYINARIDTIVLPPTIREISGGAFMNTQLKSINLPMTLRKIEGSCFQGCNLETITLPDSLEVIGTNAFSNCQFKEISFPEGLKEIGNGAFSNCENLERIDLPVSLRKIGGNAFAMCKSLKSVSTHSDLESIGEGAFDMDAQLKDVNFGGKVKNLNGFTRCTALEEITIPDGTQTLGYGIFSGCTSLKSVSIPKEVFEIGAYAFTGCKNLKELTLPSALKNLTYYVIKDCDQLESLSIGENTELIEGEAFSGCKNLKKIIVRRITPPLYNSSTFTQEIIDLFNNAEVIIPVGRKSTYANTDFWKNFKNFTEQEIESKYYNFSVWIGESGEVECNGITMTPGDWNMLAVKGEPVTFIIRCDDDHEPDRVEMSSDYGWQQYGDNIHDNQLTIDKVGENRKITFSFCEAKVYLDILQNDMGRVRLNVKKHYQYAYRVKEQEGWRVHSITFNGEETTDEIGEDGCRITPIVNDDSVIRIAFEKTTGISPTSANNLKVLGNDEGLSFKGLKTGEYVSIYTLEGRLVKTFIADSPQASVALCPGTIYLIRTELKTIKIRL